MGTSKDYERLVAGNTNTMVWLRFQRLTSPTLCRGIISARAHSLSDEVLARKAEGLASTVRSLMGYWQTSAPTLNAKIVTRYYAWMQASIAEQVASADPIADLASVQRHTVRGHGLSTIESLSGDFPSNYHISALDGGHFAAYAKSRGIDLSAYELKSRPKDWAKMRAEDQNKVLSLADLLRRVPELLRISGEALGGHPLCFRVLNSTREVNSARGKGPIEVINGEQVTLASVLVNADAVPAEWLIEHGLPFTNYQKYAAKDDRAPRWVGELRHPSGTLWWDYIDPYKSDYCGTSIIAPFWGCTDVFLLNLAILYALSIVVRYLPSLWYRVEHTDLDHVRVLIEHYLSIVDEVGPTLALGRITGVPLIVSVPGSLNAPI